MRPPLRTLVYPLPDNGDLIRPEGFLLVRRGHDLVGIRMGDALQDQGSAGIARHDGLPAVPAFQRIFPDIEAETALDRRLVRTMAGIAVFREDGLDLGREIDLFAKHQGRQERHDEMKGNAHVWERYARQPSFFHAIRGNLW